MTQPRPPKISLGLPVYNSKNTIRNALDALLGQTFTDFELIISDNCSDDGTFDICREYAERDPRIRLYRNESNLGITENFRIVCRKARGEYFHWVAGDDSWAKEYLATLSGMLDSSPRASLAAALLHREYEDGSTLPTIRYEGKDNPEKLPRFLIAARCISSRTKIRDKKYGLFVCSLMRTKYLQENIDFMPLQLGERPLIAFLALCGPILVFNTELMIKRLHRNPFCVRNPDDAYSTIDFHHSLLDKLKMTFAFLWKTRSISPLTKIIHLPLLAGTLLTERKVRKAIKLRLKSKGTAYADE
jgi:glycosyltransferase involved in cell wall biosynthesis